VDTAILLNRTEDRRTIKSIQRYGEDIEESTLEFDPTSRMITLGAPKSQQDDANVAGSILHYLDGEGEPKPERDIHDAVEGRRQCKVRILRDLLKVGKVIRSGCGGKTNPYRYASRHSCSQVPVGIVVPKDFTTSGNMNEGPTVAVLRGNEGQNAIPPGPRPEHGNKNKSYEFNQVKMEFPMESELPSDTPPLYVTEDIPPLSTEEPDFGNVCREDSL
jgi:hypothetical protein